MNAFLEEQEKLKEIFEDGTLVKNYLKEKGLTLPFPIYYKHCGKDTNKTCEMYAILYNQEDSKLHLILTKNDIPSNTNNDCIGRRNQRGLKDNDSAIYDVIKRFDGNIRKASNLISRCYYRNQNGELCSLLEAIRSKKTNHVDPPYQRNVMVEQLFLSSKDNKKIVYTKQNEAMEPNAKRRKQNNSHVSLPANPCYATDMDEDDEDDPHEDWTFEDEWPNEGAPKTLEDFMVRKLALNIDHGPFPILLRIIELVVDNSSWLSIHNMATNEKWKNYSYKCIFRHPKIREEKMALIHISVLQRIEQYKPILDQFVKDHPNTPTKWP